MTSAKGLLQQNLPKAVVSRCNKVRPKLLDDLIGSGEQHRRNFGPERLRGAQIEHQFEQRGLQDRQFGRLGAAQDATGVDTALAIGVLDTGAIAEQAADRSVFAQRIDGDNATVVGKCDDLLAPIGEQRIGSSNRSRAMTWNALSIS